MQQANDFDFGAYLDEVKEIETNVDRSASEVLVMNASRVTPKHSKRASKIEESVVDGMAVICELLFYTMTHFDD